VTKTAELVEMLAPRAGGGGLLVVTGAGVSAASGVPTFRGTDPDAVWANDVMELGTFRYFARDPVGSWSWYLRRFDRTIGSEPNDAHRALSELERREAARGAPFLLVTQNIDTLHEQAGSTALVKVHGSADRVRCARVGCRFGAPEGSLPRAAVDLRAFREAPGVDTLPRCPDCGTPVRQHVLWFDETYDSHADYRFADVLEAAFSADRVLFVGTSFSVGVTDAVLGIARRRRATVLSIDPGAGDAPAGVRRLVARAEEALPEALRAAGA
jgi:NAD-dependent deacetylase